MSHLLVVPAVMFSCAKPAADMPAVTSAEPGSVTLKSAIVYTSAPADSLRFHRQDTLQVSTKIQPTEKEIHVYLDLDKTYQEVIGIGAAITDAAAETYDKMSADRQKELVDAYFGPTGNQYSLMRTHIHSCDFSSGSYTYVEDMDTNLSSFNLAHDQEHRLPLIKKAIAQSGNPDFKVYVSPWSPPAWMKTNGDMLHGGKLKPEYARNWAQYISKFITEYEKEGVPIWGLTVQNEPMAKQIWESCIYTAEDERDFIKNHLGPVLHENGQADKKLIGWDHNRDLIYHRANTILSDPEAAKYVWGIGYHWYEDWSGADQAFGNVRNTQTKWPNVNLMFTEGCTFPYDESKLGDWSMGMRYGRSMIEDFNAGAVGWTDWNIWLDETGGPNHVGNFCFAPVHADTRTDAISYTSSYYFIGHFSRFVKPGARRLLVSPSRSDLLATAFRNPDNTVVLVVLNASDESRTYDVIAGQQSIAVGALPQSISTVIIQL